MKTTLIALLCAATATAATAQLASPISPGAGPTVRVPPAGSPTDQARLRDEKEKVKADKARLKAAKASGDEAAIRAEEETLRRDMAVWKTDRDLAADANGAESLKR
jgi:hypothetical protein